MCGILALIHANPSETSAAGELHEALYHLQHRGQDACGVATCAPGGRIYQCKGNGIVSKVFRDGSRVQDLPGYMGIGHLRYPTAGSSANAEAQPFYVNSPYGICFAHNGNLVNARELKNFLDIEAHRHINTDSDSELMLNAFANELNETGKARVNDKDIFAALSRMYTRCVGGWACTAMLAGFGLIGFRDAYGIRPLVIGKRPSEGGGMDWMMASESVALDQRGYTDIKDILPGQAVIIPRSGDPIFAQVQKTISYTPDILPDSILDGISVHESREAMGVKLAQKIALQLTAEELAEIDVVIPVPETANTAATRVAAHLKKPYTQGFVKLVEGTFALKYILDTLANEIIDRVVNMARESGARKVYFASCAPRITHAHIYGIDLASPSDLIAHHRDEKAIADHIGVAKVIYQTLEDLIAACATLSPRENQKFEIGVFCGSYVTPVAEDYFEHLDRLRGESKRLKTVESARQAVAKGYAGEREFAMAVNGAKVNSQGTVVPAAADYVSARPIINGDGKKDETTGSKQPSQQMDISLHNVADYGQETPY